MDKVLKVVRIDENNKCSIINWKPGDKINGQNKDHETLFALESEGLKLGMFGMEWTLDVDPPLSMIKDWDINARNYIRPGINKLATDDVNIQVVHSAVGGIVLSDVDLASATESLIIGFNVRPDSQARNMAQSKGIDVRTYNIIYELLDDISEAVLGQMTVKTEEAIIGMVEVKTTFRAPKVGVVAGSSAMG